MPQTRIRRNSALLALAPALLALQACSDPIGSSAEQGARLEDARREWESQGIRSYRYVIYKSCGECLPETVAPARVEVRDGQTVSVEALSATRPIQRAAFDDYDRVEDLFGVIRSTLDSDPDVVQVNYDPRTGVPVNFHVDFERQAVDDERGFTVSSFETLP